MTSATQHRNVGLAAGDALSFTLKHDTDGAAEAINTLSATYTMDAISLTVLLLTTKPRS